MQNIITIITLLTLISCNSQKPFEAINQQTPTEFQQLHNGFAIDLYKNLAQTNGNIFFSPFSIYSALAMTSEGADGQTLQEMAKTLKLDQLASVTDIRPLILDQLNQLNNSKGIELAVANRLWGHRGYQFDKSFMQILEDSYQAKLVRIDFVTAPDIARKTINSWVEKKTKDRIKDLLAEGIITQLTRLVLVNAIYFKGDWKIPFDPKRNRTLSFFNGGTQDTQKASKVEMMSNNKKFLYGETKELQILELPYGKSGLSMMVYLPKKRDGLAELEKELTQKKMKEWSASLAPIKVNLLLPKFKLTQSFNLKQSLTQLGMVEAFDQSKANFQKMNGKRDLFISAVVHKAFLEVNEKGSEAAAATAVVMGLKSMGMPEKTKFFVADHPFIFTIEDRKSKTILFMGRLEKI